MMGVNALPILGLRRPCMQKVEPQLSWRAMQVVCSYRLEWHVCKFGDCLDWRSGLQCTVTNVLIDREGNDPADSSQITYGELLKQVCKFANVLKAKGLFCDVHVGTGDRAECCVFSFLDQYNRVHQVHRPGHPRNGQLDQLHHGLPCQGGPSGFWSWSNTAVLAGYRELTLRLRNHKSWHWNKLITNDKQ